MNGEHYSIRIEVDSYPDFFDARMTEERVAHGMAPRRLVGVVLYCPAYEQRALARQVFAQLAASVLPDAMAANMWRDRP